MSQDGASGEAATADGFGALVRAAILLIMEFVVVSLLIPAGWMQDIRTREREAMQADLGVRTAAAIVVTANAWYDAVFVAPGVVAASYRLVTLSPQDIAQAKASGLGPLSEAVIWPWIEERLGVLWAMIEHAVRRLVLLVSWWPFAVLIGLGASADGFLRRRVRQHSFAYASPLRHHLAVRLMVWTGAVATLALFLPIAWSPLAPPAVMAGAAALLGLALANTPKRV
jgi:hypothetical protein